MAGLVSHLHHPLRNHHHDLHCHDHHDLYCHDHHDLNIVMLTMIQDLLLQYIGVLTIALFGIFLALLLPVIGMINDEEADHNDDDDEDDDLDKDPEEKCVNSFPAGAFKMQTGPRNP